MINPFHALLGAFSRDLGIDLGTANTMVHVRGKGIMITEPSVVAMDRRTKRVKAVGAEAKAMVGKTPGQHHRRAPAQGWRDRRLRRGREDDGVLHQRKAQHDLAAPARGRRRAVRRHRGREARGQRCGAERQRARGVSSSRSRWLRRSAPGCRSDEPMGSMIVDIGGGTTEVAVISLGGIVINHSMRIAGDEIDEAIIQFARREYNLLIGERMAEKAKIAAGSAYPLDEEITVMLRGRDLLTGLPKAVEVSSVELREGIAGPVTSIVEEVRIALEETPPELVADIMEHGIMLAGGGALLHGLDRRIMAETRMPVHIADDPLSCVARGAGRMVEEFANPAYHAILERTQASRSTLRNYR